MSENLYSFWENGISRQQNAWLMADCMRSCTKMLRVSPFSFVGLLRLRLWHKMDKAFKTPREYVPNSFPARLTTSLLD